MPVARRVAIAVVLLTVPAGFTARHTPVRAREKTRYSLLATAEPVNHAAFA